jgi:N-acetyl-anhydromuramyl-L-alanine amidase AmpD
VAIKDIIDFSTFTDPGTAFDLFSNSIRRAFTFDSYGGKTKFQAVVLTNPIPVSPNDLKYFISNQSGSSEKISQFVYRARIVGENSPHQFIPDPCDPQYAGNQEESYKIIEMHTLFVSNEEESNGASLPRINSLVEVELEKNVFGYNLGHGKHIGIVTNQDRISKLAERCDSAQSIMEDGDVSSLEDITTRQNLGLYKIANRKPGDVREIVLHNTDSPGSNHREHRDYADFALGNGGAKKLANNLGKRDDVSVHWVVDGNGEAVSMVPEKDIAIHGNETNSYSIGIEMVGYHAGVWSKCFDKEAKNKDSPNYDPDTERFCPKQIPPKRDPIRGATDGYSHMYNEKMVETVSQLVADILLRWGLEANKKTIRTHESILPLKKSDPGVSWGNFDLEDFIGRVQEKKKRNRNNIQIIPTQIGAQVANVTADTTSGEPDGSEGPV